MTHLSSCLTSKFWVSVSFASQESNWLPQQPPHLLTRVQRGKKKILGSLGSYVGTTVNEGLQTACSAILLFLRSPLSPILPERSFGLKKTLLSGYCELVNESSFLSTQLSLESVQSVQQLELGLKLEFVKLVTLLY